VKRTVLIAGANRHGLNRQGLVFSALFARQRSGVRIGNFHSNLKGRRLEEDPRYWDNEIDPGAKRAGVLFFQHFSRAKRSGVRIGTFSRD
jgi:hypothetical protein